MANQLLLADLSAQDIGGDVLICSASFEERCTAIAEAVDSEAVRKVLVFTSERLLERVQPSIKKIRKRFAGRTTVVPFDGSNPISFADTARQALSKSAMMPERGYILDVTTFTHENLLILLSLLRMITGGVAVRIAYAAAGEYTVSGGEWLSRVYSDVRTVLGYPGEMRPACPEHLIVLVGFETERAERLIRTYEPSLLALGRCEEARAIEPRFHARNIALHGQLKRIRHQVSTFEFSCDDPMVARNHILAVVASQPEHNAVVAPMNTKLSTVGAALAAFTEPRIQLCYVPAREYNEEGYSRKGNRCYLYEAVL